jgi:hypothetical protein
LNSNKYFSYSKDHFKNQQMYRKHSPKQGYQYVESYEVKPIEHYLEIGGRKLIYIVEWDKGICEFSKWYSSKSVLSPIKEQLDDLVLQMFETKWLEEPKRELLRKQIRESIIDFITGLTKQTPRSIYQSWIKEMEPFCFQGGYGHSFTYPHSPHHWVIRPEHYQAKGQIPEIVEVAACILGCKIEIAKVAQTEVWGR